MALTGFLLEALERHKELVRKMAKLYFEEDDVTGMLVNVSWNEEHRRICGYYYDTAVRDCMPLRGGYVDLEQCIPCTVDDIDETHAAYLAKMRRERESGERAGDQLEPWEVKEMKDEAVRDVLQVKVQEGRMTYRKYKQGLENLTLSGYLFDDEYESDCDERPCGED